MGSPGDRSAFRQVGEILYLTWVVPAGFLAGGWLGRRLDERIGTGFLSTLLGVLGAFGGLLEIHRRVRALGRESSDPGGSRGPEP